MNTEYLEIFYKFRQWIVDEEAELSHESQKLLIQLWGDALSGLDPKTFEQTINQMNRRINEFRNKPGMP